VANDASATAYDPTYDTNNSYDPNYGNSDNAFSAPANDFGSNDFGANDFGPDESNNGFQFGTFNPDAISEPPLAAAPTPEYGKSKFGNLREYGGGDYGVEESEGPADFAKIEFDANEFSLDESADVPPPQTDFGAEFNTTYDPTMDEQAANSGNAGGDFNDWGNVETDSNLMADAGGFGGNDGYEEENEVIDLPPPATLKRENTTGNSGRTPSPPPVISTMSVAPPVTTLAIQDVNFSDDRGTTTMMTAGNLPPPLPPPSLILTYPPLSSSSGRWQGQEEEKGREGFDHGQAWQAW